MPRTEPAARTSDRPDDPPVERTGDPASAGRRRILDEAAMLFLRQGYAETSLRHIARASGMQAGSIYYHFESKDALLQEILRIGIEAVDDEFVRIAGLTADEPADVRLAEHIRAHLAALFDHGAYTAAHVSVFMAAPAEVRAASIPLRDGYEDRWQELLDEVADELGADPTLDRTLLRRLLLGAMSATLEWFDPRGDHALDDVARTLTHTVVSALTAPITVPGSPR